MVQISKLTKGELAITGFKNRSIASRFMKQILNKKARDFKDKVELINALTTKYFEMKNYGIDLNDIAKVERNVKQVDKFVKKSQEEFEQFKIDNMDDETVMGWNIDEYLKKNIQSIFPFRKNIWSLDVVTKLLSNQNLEQLISISKDIDFGKNQDKVFQTICRKVDTSFTIDQKLNILLDANVKGFNHLVFDFLKTTHTINVYKTNSNFEFSTC